MTIKKSEYNSILDILKDMLIFRYEYIKKDTIQFYLSKPVETEDGFSDLGDQFYIPNLKEKIKYVLLDKVKF